MESSWTNMLERRRLMRTAGMSAVAAAFTMKTLGAKAATSNLDPAILNFALNLEYLEAEYYNIAVFGETLAQRGVPLGGSGTGRGTQGTVTGGSRVTFSSRTSYQLAAEIANDEYHHVVLLQQALQLAGYDVVAEPSIDLVNSFTFAAQAAGLIQSGQTFSPFANENDFLLGAFIFEDVGVSAYAGAAALITSSTYLTVAAQILAVEAYHAGEIRTRLLLGGFGSQSDKIAALRASASGHSEAAGTSTSIGDHGVLTNNVATVVDADSTALAYKRTPGEVLNVVYLTQGTNGGGFFPNGVNGTFTTASS